MTVDAGEPKGQRREKPWNRCDGCGRFIARWQFEIGAARRWLVTPDSQFSRETFRTACVDCRSDLDD
jgi:hypothetical protein